MNCKYCGNHINLEDWIQKIYPEVCLICLIDGTHKSKPKTKLEFF